MPDSLSQQATKTLEFIQEFTEKNGLPPTIKEIADHLGVKPPSAFAHVQRLAEAGYIKRNRKQWRSIQIIEAAPNLGMPVKEMACVPVVGRVAAGTPILAEENIEDHLYLESSSLPKRGTLFALKVKGDSMIRANIVDGDYLIVRQQPVADDGDIVVAIIGNEGTVKRLKMERDSIELLPENPRHKPIRVEQGDEFRIVGKALGVYRCSQPTKHP